MTSENDRQKSVTRLPTSLTTVILLVLAFLPLGLFAIFETLDHASDARDNQRAEVNLLAEVGARHLTRVISEKAEDLETAVTSLAAEDNRTQNCRRILDEAFGSRGPVLSVALFDDRNQSVCETPGAEAAEIPEMAEPGTVIATIDPEGPSIVLAYVARNGGASGVAMLDRQSLALLPRPNLLDRNYEIALWHDGEKAVVRPWSSAVPEESMTSTRYAIGGTDLELMTSFEQLPLSPGEVFRISLPVIMWLFAVLFGWIAIALLLIRPLRKLRQAVIDHANGTARFQPPDFPASAVEIQQLSVAFETAFDTVQRHEEQLAAGLDEQTRLTREVHHRVKNNLQVIASLLNLHARAAKSEDGAAAYASIQRRVDALAIVQRNLFAELDKDTGLPFRPVVAELASGLQQSAAADVKIAITLDIDPVRVGQDIAAPAAFLITELVELAMLCGNRIEIAITVTALADNCARLSIRSPVLADASSRDEFPRYRRVLTGMARQLQASLDEEESGTLFTIMMPTLGHG